MSPDAQGPFAAAPRAPEPVRDGRPAPFFPVRPRDRAVRPLPFPYRGALAISNDAEFLRMDFFEALMRFLNTRDSTPLGPGLGLRVTSSLFFHSAQPYNDTYFDGAAADAPPSRHAARYDEFLRSGLIDTIHAYGDFDGTGGCTRAHAEAAFRALEKVGVRLPVFSNHGSRDNVQNIGTDADYHRGDHPGDAAYHADLLASHGVRYVWTDSLVIAESGPTGWRGAWRRWRRPPPSELLTTSRLTDGSTFLGFRRFRGTGACAPNFSSLGAQVAQFDWPAMYDRWGASVMYQHLGVLQRSGGVCEPATIDALRRRPDVYLAPFRVLQAQQDAGRLWVCGCADLLRYVEMVRDVTVRRDAAADTLTLEFPRPVPEPAVFFAGLTLAADPGRPLRVTFGGRDLPVAWNGPDAAGGGYSVTVTRPTAINPW